MKKHKTQDEFLEQLKKVPIVQVACEKVGLSRNTVYRWRKEDAEFAARMDTALLEGEELVNDMSESQLLSLIRDKNWNAISFWLRKRNPKFADKIEVSGDVRIREELTDEEASLVREAIQHVMNFTDPAYEPHRITREDPEKPQAPHSSGT